MPKPKPRMQLTEHSEGSKQEHRITFGKRFSSSAPEGRLEEKASTEYAVMGLIWGVDVGTHGTARMFIKPGDSVRTILREYGIAENESALRKLEGVTKAGYIIRHITVAGRKRGLGTKALEEFERIAKGEGIQLIFATTDEDNSVARRTYAKRGWILLGSKRMPSYPPRLAFGKFL